MRRIIYQSVAAPDFDKAALFRLVFHAREANQKAGLSGFLLCSNQRFLQVLEGDPWKLVDTFKKIRADVRHSNVEVIDERSVQSLMFTDWRMRCFYGDDAGQALDLVARQTNGEVPKIVKDAIGSFFGGDVPSSPEPLRTHAI